MRPIAYRRLRRLPFLEGDLFDDIPESADLAALIFAQRAF